MPGLPNIQALTPATRKKIMSAIVATAKFWSARRDRSDHFVRCLAFILNFLRRTVRDPNISFQPNVMFELEFRS